MAGGTQVPRPLQVAAGVSVVPVQLVARQVVPIGCSRQAPAPSQPPARPQVDAGCIAHWLRGSWPDGTATQVPSWPGTLQAKHIWPHWLAQQIPSTQKPVPHSLLPTQDIPCVRLTVHRLAAQ